MNKFTLVLLLGLSTSSLIAGYPDFPPAPAESEHYYQNFYGKKNAAEMRAVDFTRLWNDYVNARNPESAITQPDYWTAKLGLTIFEKALVLSRNDTTNLANKMIPSNKVVFPNQTFAGLLDIVIGAAAKANVKTLHIRALVHMCNLNLAEKNFRSAYATSSSAIEIEKQDEPKLAELGYAYLARVRVRLAMNAKTITQKHLKDAQDDLVEASGIFLKLPAALAAMQTDGSTKITEYTKALNKLKIVKDGYQTPKHQPQKPKPRHQQDIPDYFGNSAKSSGTKHLNNRGIAQKSDHRGGGRNSHVGQRHSMLGANYRNQDTKEPQSRRAGLNHPVKQEEQN